MKSKLSNDPGLLANGCRRRALVRTTFSCSRQQSLILHRAHRLCLPLSWNTIRKNLGTSPAPRVCPGTNGIRHCDIIRIGSHSHPSMAKAKYSHDLIQYFFGKNTELNQLSPETLKTSAHGCPVASRILFPSWTGVYVGSGPERSQTHRRSRFLASVSTGAAYFPLLAASHLSRGKPEGTVGPSLTK